MLIEHVPGQQAKSSRVFEDLIWKAKVRTMVGCPDEHRLRRALAKGEPIPEICKPGYLLKQLTPKERKELSMLTSDTVSQHGWIDYDFSKYHRRK